ncbi:hypothetical protein HMN09_01067100 [Mycena chlorophos]|uniref:Uncharacterized protein n=1 Tax=Mycena chlorophos TaxID=658473 RepID=A0A8H6VYL2_MYCCL|nr:hypothetical protein HMN09_01067100 [Mycena chlorophos]
MDNPGTQVKLQLLHLSSLGTRSTQSYLPGYQTASEGQASSEEDNLMSKNQDTTGGWQYDLVNAYNGLADNNDKADKLAGIQRASSRTTAIYSSANAYCLLIGIFSFGQPYHHLFLGKLWHFVGYNTSCDRVFLCRLLAVPYSLTVFCSFTKFSSITNPNPSSC